jgi:O-methyltransferase involved in polyketide biosynthesis
MTCMTRAFSVHDRRPDYRCGHTLAVRLLPAAIAPFVRIGLARRFFASRLAPFGMFEYVVTRTKRFDEAFSGSVAEGYDQILILGAGFDTRACRLLPAGSRTKVFELDAVATQAAKRAQYTKRGIHDRDSG